MPKSLIGIAVIFMVLFIPQCITVPAMYETAETKEGKRRGISVQYGEGSYYKGLCEPTKYNYKYGGIRIDYGKVKQYKNIVEAGLEIGSSINGVYEISSSDPSYHREVFMLQIDGRLTGKIVTPTNPVRLGLNVAPGLLAIGGISRINGRNDIFEEISGFHYLSLLLGIGRPEFLTLGYSYYPFLVPLLTATYHHKKYSFTAGSLLPPSREGIIKCHFILGLGINY